MDGSNSLAQLSIHHVSSRLYLITLPKEVLHSSLKPLIKCIFFPQRDSFFSYTETEDEVSILLDAHSFHLFKNNITGPSGIVISPGSWHAIQIYEGLNLINEVGLISRISASITEGEGQLNVLYLSQIKSDVILVKDDFLEEAKRKLAAAIKSPLRVSQLLDKDRLKALNKVIVTPLSERLFIMSAKDTNLLPKFSHSLLQSLLFSKSEKRFFSFTSTPSEMSLILSEEHLNLFSSELFDIDSTCWKAIQVGSGATGTSGGNVTILSGVLAKANISLLYLSTFNTDFILVPESKAPAALDCLKTELNVIVEEV